jgi:hypothetical protein
VADVELLVEEKMGHVVQQLKTNTLKYVSKYCTDIPVIL